jgi:mRNA interferase RelE/StbE
MLEVSLTRAADKFLDKVPAKHYNQIFKKITELQEIGITHDSKKIIGTNLLRADVGEYRIIYGIENNILLIIVLIGKRNDDDVYRKLERMGVQNGHC